MTIKHYFSRLFSRDAGHAQGAVQATTAASLYPKTFLTATDVVRLTEVSLEATRFSADVHGARPSPWLTLWLKEDFSDQEGQGQGSQGLGITGAQEPAASARRLFIRVSRNSSPIDLASFDLSAMDEAKTAFKAFQDQLLAEVVPESGQSLTGHAIKGDEPRMALGSSRATEQAQAPRRTSTLKKAALWGAGACGAYLVLAFILGGTPAPAVAPGGDSAAAGGIPPEMDSAANKAWGMLTKEQQAALIDVAQRSLVSAAEGGQSAAATAPATAASSAAAVVDAEAKRATSIPNTAAAGATVGATPGAAAAAGGKLSAVDFKRLGQAALIVTRPGSTIFYAFVDPMCPSCQDLDGKVAGLDKKYGMVTVPVAFQTGARDQAAAALCAKNKVEAWALAMRVQPIGTKPCDEGYKQIDANNKLFLSLGLDATPVLLAPNLRLAKGSAETVQIASWIDANLK